MKKLLFSLLFIPLFVYGQDDTNAGLYPVNENTDRIEFSEIVEAVSLSKDQLFSNAQTWIANTFGDYKNVIQFEDKETGKLILKGNSSQKKYL